PIVIINGRSFTGVFPELLQAFADKKGYVLEYQVYPLKRQQFLYYSKDSAFDIRFPDNPYWDKELKQSYNLSYSKFSLPFTEGVIVLAENEGKITELTSLGTLRGFTVWPYKDEISSGKIKIEEADSIPSLLSMLLGGRFDGLYMSYDVANYFMKKLHPSRSIVLDKKFKIDSGSYFLSSLRNSKIVEEFDFFINDNQKLLNELKQKYNL
ncbi:MAG: transporter substrate-binding domain-containing protein, partial [Spirochaetales bacterium]|nr:transporter substrate-binding domain-containing protein [Spirochaetales bacterium]